MFPPSGIVDGETLTFNDPLQLLPYEPRYYLQPLIQNLEDILNANQVTAADINNEYHVIALQNGQIYILNQQTAVWSTTHSNTEDVAVTALRMYHGGYGEEHTVIFFSGSTKGTVVAHFYDPQANDYYSRKLVQSQVDNAITTIDINEQLDTLIFGTASGHMYHVTLPPQKPGIQQLFQPQIVGQQIPVLEARFIHQNYICFLTRCEFVVFDTKTFQQVTKINIKQCVSGAICVDGNCVIVGYDDIVQVLLLRFPTNQQFTNFSGVTPFCLSLNTALGYLNANCFNSNFNAGGANFYRFNNFGDGQEWDGALVYDHTQLKAQQTDKYVTQLNVQAPKEIIIEEINKIQLWEPKMSVCKLQTCGESICILGVTNAGNSQQGPQQQHESGGGGQPQNENADLPDYLMFNASKYIHSQLEQEQCTLQLQLIDVLGNYQYSTILPIFQPLSRQSLNDQQIKQQYTQLIHSIIQFINLEPDNQFNIPHYLVTTSQNSYLLSPCSIDQHIKYLLDNQLYSMAIQASLILKQNQDCDQWQNIVPFSMNQSQYAKSMFIQHVNDGFTDINLPLDLVVATYDNLVKLQSGDYQEQETIIEQGNQQEGQAGPGEASDAAPHQSLYLQQLQQLQEEQYQIQDGDVDEQDEDAVTAIQPLSYREQVSKLFVEQQNKTGTKQILGFLVKHLLDTQQSHYAASLLNTFLRQDDQQWNNILVQFGLSNNFKHVVAILPQFKDPHQQMLALAISYSYNYDILYKLSLKYKVHSFYRYFMCLFNEREEVQHNQQVLTLIAYYRYLELNDKVYANKQDYINTFCALLQSIIKAITNESKQKLNQIYQQLVVNILSNNISIKLTTGESTFITLDELFRDTEIKQLLINNADKLFEIDPQLSAKLFTMFINENMQVLQIFVQLLIGCLKKIFGVQIDDSLTKQHYQNDFRIVRMVCLLYLVLLNKELVPEESLISNIFTFLFQVGNNLDFKMLTLQVQSHTSEDFRNLSLQNYLVAYAAIVDKQIFTDILNKCDDCEFTFGLQLLQQYSDLDSLLKYVLQHQQQQGNETMENQISGYQTALQVCLSKGSVGQAIKFIRRLQDMHSNNVQQMRILRQAQLWKYLTRHLCDTSSVYELLRLLSRESVPIDVQEVVDMVQIEDDAGRADRERDGSIQMADTIFKLINSLRLINQLQQQCAELVKQDCVVLRQNYISDAKKCCFISQMECQYCECDAYQEFELQEMQQQVQIYGDQIVRDKRFGDYVVFNCGHCYHFQCLIKSLSEQMCGVSDWVCPSCYAKGVTAT